MSETPRYATLRDYLRVIRAQRVLIALMTLVFAVAGLGISLIQHKTYTASAQVNFRDVNADLAVVGRGSTPETTPDQRAAENADLVTRPEVNQEVKRLLNSPQSPDQLASDISAQVAATTNFVVIQASDSSPHFAADLANAYART